MDLTYRKRTDHRLQLSEDAASLPAAGYFGVTWL
jgi:hypothetical protein